VINFYSMNPLNKLVLFIVALLLVPTLVDAQSFYALRRSRSLILTVGTGNASYFGELKEDKDYLDAKLNITGGLQYYVSPSISVRMELTYFQLHGDDAKTVNKNRNLSFTSGNFEWNATGAINLFEKGQRFYQRPNFNVYAFTGIGLLYTNPKAELNGKKIPLQPLQTEGNKYSKLQPVIPLGLGVRVKAGPLFNVALEGGYRFTFTDYLDDVSTVHQDKSTWTDPVRIALSDRRPELGLPPNEIGSKRGDPSTNDGYFLLNIKVEYYLSTNFLFDDQRRYYNQRRKSFRKGGSKRR
jgi:hypothetical protein